MRWALILALTCFSATCLAEERPSFVIMMCDDQRYDALSCAGNAVLRTPHLDRIAAEGVTFKNAYVTNALCAPSRATLMTGLYAHAHGVPDNFGRQIPAQIKILPDYLRDAGYEVAFCGKSHQKGAWRERQWDYYFGYQGQGRYLDPIIAEGTDGKDQVYEGYMDDVVTDKALAWLKRPRSKPFCLFLFFKAPHRQWVPAPRHRDLFADATIAKPPLWDEPGRGKPLAFLLAANMIGQFPDTKDFQGMVKDYYRTLTAVDENVGKVYATLREQNILDRTVLLHTSDNGFFLGEWQRFDKRFMHEPSIRVPLLVRYPPLAKPGSTCTGMVINTDLAPTVMDLAGVNVPASMQGRSWKPLLAGQPVEWRKDWYYEYLEYPDPSHNVQKMCGVRTENHKLIHYYAPPERHAEEFELYDLQNDPEERVNLYSRPASKDLGENLKARIKELQRELGRSPSTP
jgi:arylsulfatase A-like enzyme